MSTVTVSSSFDVIVVGGGHAGIEAAAAAARMGSRTLLLTLNLDRIGHMPCNPAIGGIGKGHIVFEIAALGGIMPQLATKTYLQARMLNTRKGPAVQGLRLQIDKTEYSKLSRQMLEKMPNLTILMGMADEILLDGAQRVRGLRTREGAEYHAPAVILTTGTFLNGLVHVGHTNYAAGRQNEEAVTQLSRFLKNDLALQIGRLKTGTPPRLLRSSLNFKVMEVQGSDPLEYLFEFGPHRVSHKMDCYITRTTEKTHDIIKRNAQYSPIYSGKITGIAPRYCPSIEDKIHRFPDKTGHQVFVEPESASSDEIYPNGLSTSLPLPVQQEFIRSIPGFEQAIIARPGYAIEYDFVLPHQLHHTLELKAVPGLFLAGQINGTTGYEEAAGQGIIAGINAHASAHALPPFVLERTAGYIGIMIDDLVSLGVDEPYRMFTSRAERRLLLRQDNVFYRLGKCAQEVGLISSELHAQIEEEHTQVKTSIQQLKQQYGITITQHFSGGDPETVKQLIATATPLFNERARLSIFAELLYEPYLQREQREAQKTVHYQELVIPDTFEYTGLSGLSIELQQKLTKYRPKTIAAAALIPGMTPAALSLLIFKVRETKK